MIRPFDSHVDLHNDNYYRDEEWRSQSEHYEHGNRCRCRPSSPARRTGRTRAVPSSSSSSVQSTEVMVVENLCRWPWSSSYRHRWQKQNNSQLHLFGLLSLLCCLAATATVSEAAKAGSSGSGSSASAVSATATGTTSNTSLRNIEDENVPLFISEAVQGTQGRLPCNVTPPIVADKVILVIWYKDGLSTPIYSFDVRDSKFEKGSHWVDERKFGGRAYFQAGARPAAALIIDNTTNADSGLYRCRVDFHKSPTRNARVQLRVIIPPEKVLMLDERGVHIPDYILGPYNEDSSINITCVSIGGSPLPNVTWMHENTVLKSDFVVLSEKRVKNVLHLERLQRSHLHRVLTCHAANNNVTQPIISSVTLDLNLRPLWVKLQGENRPLSAGNTVELQCQVVGSKPEPTITWWKGSQPMRNTKQMMSGEGNVTTSILSFVPTIDDRGKFLSCRAEQTLIPDSGKEDGWKLDIYHIPVVTLEFGTNLNSTSSIREGADVYFECNIKSNPWIYRVSWRHNGKILDNNPAEGIAVSNQSLVLQNVSRSRAGMYTCVGSNREGDGESNPVNLDIKFAPVCRPGQRDVYSTARGEAVMVACELEANPTKVNVTWKFNGTNAENIDIPTSDIHTALARSTAKYLPNSEHDYGTLLCWGTNELGKQAEPCIFNILPAGRPDPVTNCSLVNITFDMVYIECAEGFNGGLKQEFKADVLTSDFRHQIKTVRSRTPTFQVHNLQSGVHYGVELFAVNEKGESDGTRVPVYTLKNPEKQTDLISTAPVIEDIKPFLPVIMGAAGGLVLIGLLVIVIVRCRGGTGGAERNMNTVNNTCANHTPTNHNLSNDSDESMEKNPDIIPQGPNDDEHNENGGLGGNRQFQWINPNVHPRLYATTAQGLAEQNELRNCYERMQYQGIPENAAYTQYIQQGGHAPSTVSSQAYLTAMPSTLMPVNSVNYTTANLGASELTYADLGVMGGGNGGGVGVGVGGVGVMAGMMPGKKMPYTTATLGRPPRHPDLKRHEPTIYAQIDLARHHTSFLPNSMNTRIPLSQHQQHQQQQAQTTTTVTQLSTFPPAPLMFASPPPPNSMGSNSNESPSGGNNHHHGATIPAAGIMTTTVGGGGHVAA